jgi:hypothetical protein
MNKTVVHIGTRVEMFVDDWLIDVMSHVELKLHPPQRREVVLTTDRSWEGKTSGMYTIVKLHNGKFGLYYRGYCPGADQDERQLTCYAESTDGIHFERPELGLVEFEGSTRNNVILKGRVSVNFTPFLDKSPDVREEERYKAVGGVGRTTEHTMGNQGDLFALSSLDGIHWTFMQEEPVMTSGSFDSQNIAFWDQHGQQYRCYNRCFDEGFRAIQSATSSDFIHWSEQTPNRYEDQVLREHLYTNGTIPCPGAEHFYLSFPMRYQPKRNKMAGPDYSGLSDTIFMTSRDGVHWDRTFLEAWLRPGMDERNWTDRNGIVASGCVDTGKEFAFYVSEHYKWPDNRLRRLTVRKHGFASVHAGYTSGEFTTRPLTIDGSRLLLNYSTSAAGSIRAEVQDEAGHPLEGYSLEESEFLFGDELESEIRWGEKDLTAVKHQTLRFRFVLQDADLFAICTQ